MKAKSKDYIRITVLFVLLALVVCAAVSCIDKDSAVTSVETEDGSSDKYICKDNEHKISDTDGKCEKCGYTPYYSEGLELVPALSDAGDSGYAVRSMGECKDTEVYIPYEKDGIPVIEIAKGAFSSNKEITMVVLPHTVENIRSSAFFKCEKLDEVLLSSRLRVIEETAFSECGSLKSIVLPSGLKKLEYDVFNNCTSLESIAIPDTVTSLGDSIFYGCSSLKEVTLPQGITVLPRGTLRYCKSLQKIDIPSSVTEIQSAAFEGCEGLIEVSMGDNVEKIGPHTFRNCRNLRQIRLSAALKVLERELFSSCYALSEINIPDSVTEIKSSVFIHTAIKSITLPSSLKRMEFTWSNHQGITDISYKGTRAEWEKVIKFYPLPEGRVVHCTDGDAIA